MATPSHQTPAQAAPLPTFAGIPRVHFWEDYGPVGEGASEAHYIRAENGSEYIAKGPTLNPGLPYVAANELVCAQLATSLGLPLLDFTLIEHGPALYFGSSWLEKGKSFYPGLDATLFKRAKNRIRVYDIVAFDYWTFNTDRNAHNLLLRKGGTGGGTAELLTLNDHSHAVIQPGKTPAGLAADVTSVPLIHLDFVRAAIRSRTNFSAAVALIEGVTTATIRNAVQGVPDLFLDGAGKNAVEDFLTDRRDGLRALINGDLAAFPRLGGVPL